MRKLTPETASLGHRSERLFGNASLAVTDFRCDGACRTARAREEATSAHEIAITLGGSWRRRDASGRHFADATRVMLFNRGAPYLAEHPVDGGDHCIVVAFDDATLADAASELGVELGPGGAPLRAPSTVATPRLQLLAARLRGEASGIARHEIALQMLGCVLSQMGAPALEGSDAGKGSHRRRELAHAVEVELAREHASRVTLDGLAARMSCSPFHLARTFRAVTGGTIHQRLIALRLSAALQRLADTREGIATIAHDLGFADHAHLSALFTRRFELTPSAFRRTHATRQPSRLSRVRARP